MSVTGVSNEETIATLNHEDEDNDDDVEVSEEDNDSLI